MKNSTVKMLAFDDLKLLAQMVGMGEGNLKLLAQLTDTSLRLKGNEIHIKGTGHEVDTAFRTLVGLTELLGKGFPLGEEDVKRAVEIISADENINLTSVFMDQLQIPASRGPVAPKTLSQKRYMDAIRRDPVVFGIGPAGTGKTYLAMAMAVHFFLTKRCKRIVLARPAVEAGEKLGFLPGDIAEKVNPYLRPLWDALYDMLEPEKARRLMEQGTIEIAPLAFMRGRTLNDSFVILDEAQNTTTQQMKMFLTRLGFASKAVITGDITQIDLPQGTICGLLHASQILSSTQGISICNFSRQDVVRHPLVEKIIEAYEMHPL